MREVAVVTTGFFDGVHLGHRHVLETLVSSARERGEEAIVVTFWPHPRAVLQQDAREFRLLNSIEEKKARLLSCGVDRVEVIPFTREFAALKANEYLQLLRERFDASLVVMGYDNRIGSDRKTASELPESNILVVDELPTAEKNYFSGRCPKNQFSSAIATPTHISSTQVRQALEEGRIGNANAMLGYSYELYGVVVAGNRMGRTIGFPTANMQLYEPLKLVPFNGVYAVEVEVLGGKYKGMCNIGVRPTVDGKTRTIETHILDFDEDIYGLPLKVRFLKRIRDERKFPSLEALREQLEKDRLECI
ncbi:MAG: riboflavin biosynthesis protein RibF [Bacteroidales bacterium]|nr:riboflavin biosynthesis protein RibF [Bacteroidales bacterium]